MDRGVPGCWALQGGRGCWGGEGWRYWEILELAGLAGVGCFWGQQDFLGGYWAKLDLLGVSELPGLAGCWE